LQREESVIHIVAEDLRDMTARLGSLREHTGCESTGDGPHPAPGKPQFALRERVPGYDPRDIVVRSRDFR
jgi:hypothetical protein